MSDHPFGSYGQLVRDDPILRLYCVTETDRCAPLRRLPPMTAEALRDRVVRPVALVSRILTERYGVPPPAAGKLRVELSPKGMPSGRVVLPGGELDDADPALRLAEVVTELAGLGDVEAVLDAELRHLSRASAVALRTVGRLGHHVDEHQHTVLTAVLDRVADHTRRRRSDASLRRPAVLLALHPGDGTPGLARFVWDVYDAGGCVVFGSGRREQATHHGSATDLHLVAAFAHLAEHRRGVARQARGAQYVIVERPDELRDDDLEDGDEVIASFETIPVTGRTVPAAALDALSHTRSLAELPLAELSDHREAARSHAVWLSRRQSHDIVRTLLTAADVAAQRAADAARRAHPGDDPIELIHHVLTGSRFRKGPRGHYPVGQLRRDVAGCLARGAPIPMVTLGFPVKLYDNDLKTAGPRPDLGELGALVRLRELQAAVRAVYRPGLQLTVLTDGSHFQPRPVAVLQAYHDKLAEYQQLVGGPDVVQLADLDEVAGARIGGDVRQRREALLNGALGELTAALADLDVTAAPRAALEAAGDRASTLLGHRGDGTVMPRFADLYQSLLYGVPVTPPDGLARYAWAQRLYADVLDVTDARLGAGRQRLLRDAWRRTVRYLAVLSVDRELGYDDSSLFPGRIRLTANPRPGSLGFNYLGGSGVLPWHGTAALDPRGRLGTDFAVALYDRGFVPVFSPLLGDDQPWLMVPSTLARQGRLDDDVIEAIRLKPR